MKVVWTALKYFGILAGFTAVIYGAFRFLDDMGDDIEMVQEDVVEAQEFQFQVIDRLDTAIIQLQMVRNHQMEQDNMIRDMYQAGRFYIENQEQYTREQLNQILEEIMKDNNPYPYGPAVKLNPADSTDSIKQQLLEHDIVIVPVDTAPN